MKKKRVEITISPKDKFIYDFITEDKINNMQGFIRESLVNHLFRVSNGEVISAYYNYKDTVDIKPNTRVIEGDNELEEDILEAEQPFLDVDLL